jgi:hypothetical protein
VLQATLRHINALPKPDREHLKSLVDWVEDYGFEDPPKAPTPALAPARVAPTGPIPTQDSAQDQAGADRPTQASQGDLDEGYAAWLAQGHGEVDQEDRDQDSAVLMALASAVDAHHDTPPRERG